MAMKFNQFAWYDLVTTDADAAASFYSKVIGWNVQSIGSQEHPYSVLSAGGVNIGGLMPMPSGACEKGMQPCWRGYILVDDVDAYTARVKEAGGTVHKEPEDIPGMLRFSVVADPTGASFVLFKGMSKEPPPNLPQEAQGNIGWNELNAGDGPRAFDFYSSLFGWTRDRAMDMGDLGVYQLFAADGVTIGGMMTKMPDWPVPFWLFYFNVDGIDAAVARVKDNGGKVLADPHQVPGGSWITQCLDPQGAAFAMVAPKR